MSSMDNATAVSRRNPNHASIEFRSSLRTAGRFSDYGFGFPGACEQPIKSLPEKQNLSTQ
jgi:hypothetical protein